MLERLKQILFKNQVPFTEQIIKTKAPEIEICELHKTGEPPVVHFQTVNTNEFTDCIGTLCKRHLSSLKVNRKFYADGSYKDIPVYMQECQIKISETHRYTTDASKVTCFFCTSRLKKK